MKQKCALCNKPSIYLENTFKEYKYIGLCCIRCKYSKGEHRENITRHQRPVL